MISLVELCLLEEDNVGILLFEEFCEHVGIFVDEAAKRRHIP